MEYLNDLMVEKVKVCLEKYKEGNRYFHAMDDMIKYDSDLILEMFKQVKHNEILVLSGTFGHQVIDLLNRLSLNKPYIMLTGSPRKNEDIKLYAIQGYGIGQDFTKAVFLDDTYFTGRTHFYCKGYVESKFNIKVNRALVAYDGMKYNLGQVDSLYRYFNHHDYNGNSLE